MGQALELVSAMWDSNTLQAEMTCKDELLTLSQYINLAVCLDNLICNQPTAKVLPPVPDQGAALIEELQEVSIEGGLCNSSICTSPSAPPEF